MQAGRSGRDEGGVDAVCFVDHGGWDVDADILNPSGLADDVRRCLAVSKADFEHTVAVTAQGPRILTGKTGVLVP